MNERESKLLRKMSKICSQIAKGDYRSLRQLEKMTALEAYPVVAELAEHFSFMLVKLQAREYELEEKNKKLQKKNLDLKIDIDFFKKQKQVSEITRTKFFREIKKKLKRS